MEHTVATVPVEGRSAEFTGVRLGTAVWVALGIVLVVFSFLIIWGARVGWLPWASECNKDIACFPAPGETLSAIEAGKYYVTDGARYWFIQRLRNPYEANSPIYLYTHNLNLGAFLYDIAAHLAPNPFLLGAVLTALGFCAGLLYAFLFVRRLSGSSLFALIFLILLGGDYYFNLVFALNLVRGWHWLALFGGAYHLTRAFEQRRIQAGHLAAFILYTVLAFTLGYDFLAFAFFLSTLVALTHRARWSLWTRLGVVIGAYVFVVALRQVQVIGALGFDFWIRDLYYSSVIKTAFLHIFLPLPPLSGVDAWYRQHGVLRPYAIPESNVIHIMQGAQLYFWSLWAPRLGAVTVAVMLGGSALAVGLALLPSVMRVRRPELVAVSMTARTVVVIGLAEVLGLYFFGALSVQIYVNHRFPMLISYIMLVYAFVIYVLVRLLRMASSQRSWYRPAVSFGLAGLIVLFVVSRAAIVIRDYHALHLTTPPASAYQGRLDTSVAQK